MICWTLLLKSGLPGLSTGVQPPDLGSAGVDWRLLSRAAFACKLMLHINRGRVASFRIDLGRLQTAPLHANPTDQLRLNVHREDARQLALNRLLLRSQSYSNESAMKLFASALRILVRFLK